MNDLKFAFRQLLKNPGFTDATVLTLALGIGANTATLSVIRTTVFDPLPARHPDRLVQFGFREKERCWSPGLNPSALREARQQTNLFVVVAAYYGDVLTLRGEDFPQLVRGVWVTPGFFGLWDLRPLLGRTFAADEGRPVKDDVLVISHRLWQRQFGGDPAVIGRTVPFRERPMTVVGVMPPHFPFPEAEFDYWRPVEGPDPDISTVPGALSTRLMTFWIGVEQADPLRVMRVPLRQGRWLERGDVGEGVGHVVVNETAARRLWPGEAAVGKRFWRKERDAEVACEVVGVVGDTRDWSKQVAPEPIPSLTSRSHCCLRP